MEVHKDDENYVAQSSPSSFSASRRRSSVLMAPLDLETPEADVRRSSPISPMSPGFSVNFEEPVFSGVAYFRSKEKPRPTFGTGSALDLCVDDANALPYNINAATYLEEVLVGLKGAPKRQCAKPASANYQKVSSLLRSQVAEEVCKMLFWISTGMIFKRIPMEVIQSWRVRMATSWHRMVLEVNKLTPQEGLHRDVVLNSIRASFVQAIYRLLVDAFGPTDRAALVEHSDVAMEKLNAIINYELLGFQPNTRTTLKLRRGLFTERVIQQPFANQLKNAESQFRREILESKGAGIEPLAFGREGGQGMDELMLEDVLEGRERVKEEKALLERSRRRPAERSPRSEDWDEVDGCMQKFSADRANKMNRLLEELSVDRYSHLGDISQTLINSHLTSLGSLPTEDGNEAENIEDDLFELFCDDSSANFFNSKHSAVDDRENVPTRSTNKKYHRGVTAPVEILGMEPLHHTQSIMSKTTGFGRVSLKSGGGNHTSNGHALASHATRRAREQAIALQEKRRREVLVQLIVHDKLPEVLLQRKIRTSWVSPAVDLLAPSDRSRECLRKGASDALTVPMKPPKEAMLPPIHHVKRSISEVTLLARRNALRLPQSKLFRSESSHALGEQVPGDSNVQDAGARPSVFGLAPAPKSQPPDGTAGLRNLKISLSMEPPKRIASPVVLSRLDAHLQGFIKHSFSTYTSEVDISTGAKRSRMDPLRLASSELAYVNDMTRLLGGREGRPFKMVSIGIKGTPEANLLSTLTSA